MDNEITGSYHVTSIRNGSVYGHSTDTCDEAGCAGTEMYLGSTDELPDAVLHEELWIAETDSCDHRSGSGQASDEDTEHFSAGDECPICKCTLGADGYWYVDADQAPQNWASISLYGGNVSCRVPEVESDRARELIEAADEGGVIQATDMVGIFPGRPEMHTTTMLLSALTSIGAEIGD